LKTQQKFLEKQRVDIAKERKQFIQEKNSSLEIIEATKTLESRMKTLGLSTHKILQLASSNNHEISSPMSLRDMPLKTDFTEPSEPTHSNAEIETQYENDRKFEKHKEWIQICNDERHQAKNYLTDQSKFLANISMDSEISLIKTSLESSLYTFQ
jgi:hypothetical protein